MKYSYEFVKEYIETATDRQGNSGFKLLSEKYHNQKTKLDVLCPKGHVFQVAFRHFKGSGSRCPYCSHSKKHSFKEVKSFIEKSTDKNNKGTYKLVSEEYVNVFNDLTLQCPSNHTFKMSYANFKNHGQRCPKCFGTPKYEYEYVDEYIRSFGHMLLSDNYESIDKKIKISCSNGHIFEMRFNDFKNNNQRCPRCKTSSGENVVEKILNQNSIPFVKNYKFDNCKNIRCLPFDFYIANLNTCIEYDGRQHFIYGCFNMDLLDLMNIKYRDNIKTKYCKVNNIQIIRIPYWEFCNIEKILEKIVE